MITKYNRISLAIGIPALILQIGSQLVPIVTNPEAILEESGAANTVLLPYTLAYFLGTALLIVALAFYAKAKGQSPACGLFGLLSIIGLVILACMKDKSPPPLPST